MITRVSSVIRPKGSDLAFDHAYNDYECVDCQAYALPEMLILANSGCAKSPFTPGHAAVHVSGGHVAGLPGLHPSSHEQSTYQACVFAARASWEVTR